MYGHNCVFRKYIVFLAKGGFCRVIIPKGERTLYQRTIDLMDESVFPRESIYIGKENPKADSIVIPREDKSDEDIIAAVTTEMVNTLGADLEH
jgi:hypothetical protein